MEESIGFEEQLEKALEKKAQFLEEKHLASLRNGFRIFQTLFESIYNILLRKSLIQEDPYKYDQKISEVTPPPRDSFMESEKQDKMSQRLSQFHSQLDFLNNYYQFSLDFLTLDRIKRIVALVQYINWLRLTETSTSMITAALAEFFGKIRMGTDSLSSGIINDSVSQIMIGVKQMLVMLKEISAYQQEAYKLEIRWCIISRLPELQQASERGEAPNTDEVLNKIKRMFRQQMGEKPYYPELVREILSENFSDDGSELRAAVLDRLGVVEDKPKKAKKEPKHRAILLESVRLLALIGRPISDALRKLNDNNVMLENRRRNLGERFRQWMKRLAQGGSEAQMLEIEYFESATSTTLVEKIDFGSFVIDCQRKTKLFMALSNKMSNAFQRLQAAGEDQIFDFLNKNIKELQLTYRRLEGLDAYFRTEVPKDERTKMKGIKIELSTIKNALIKTNQKKHEFVAVKEEERQIKKLGIKVDE